MASPTINEDDLNAFVDGALSAERRQAVEDHLAQDPEAAARVADYRAQRELVHTLYDPILDEPVPERLQPTPIAYGRRLGFAAAAALLLLIGGGAGWWLRGTQQTMPPAAAQSLTQQAAAAYAVFTPEVRHPVEVGAKEEQHLVAWLSKRLKTKLKAPVLTASDFHLVGGRLLSASSGPAALFMYEDERGRRLTLYVTRHQRGVDETAFRYAYEGGIGVFYWIDSQLSYALAGEMDKAKLLALCRTIYDQLDR